MEQTQKEKTVPAGGMVFEILEKAEEESREPNKALLESRLEESREVAAERERQAREVFSEERAIDVSDIATQTEAKLLHGELALAASRAWPKAPGDFDGLHCVECDNEIPAKRLENGYFVCVSCQSIKEKRGAQFGLKPWEV